MKVSAHVAYYSVMFGATVALAYGVSKYGTNTDDEKRHMLEEKYAGNSKVRDQKKQDMQNFFNKLKAADKGQEAQMEEVLKRGKGDMKRLHELQLPDQPSNK